LTHFAVSVFSTDRPSPEELNASPDRLGVIPRAVSSIFDKAAKLRTESRGVLTYTAKSSYIEVSAGRFSLPVQCKRSY
jgi:hypothetical protein